MTSFGILWPQVNQTPMEDNAMKKSVKIKVNTEAKNAMQTRQDGAKVRCYACVNGIVIPVL